MNLKDLLSQLRNADSFCFDTETAGSDTGDALSIHSLTLVGIAFAIRPGEAYYLPVPEDYNQACKLLREFKGIFENPLITLIGHNLKYDINVLRRYDIMVKGKLWDTMIAHYLYDPTAKHGLKELSRELLGYQQIEITDLIGKGHCQDSMRDVPVGEIATYACEDADQTLQLKHKLEPLLKERKLESLFHNIECPLIYVLADMEYIGIKIDTAVLDELYEEALDKMDELYLKIQEQARGNLNLKSTHQLRKLLFEDLGLDSSDKTKKGTQSVCKKSLKRLKDAHPVVSLLLQYKELSSITSTFLETLPSKVHPLTGRVHTGFQQTRTATGRLASSQPNLQNIPRSGDFGRKIREAFVPESSDSVIIAADYSQIELRLMAVLSGDTYMTNAFNNGIDIHIATAAKIFHIPESKVGKEQRSTAKQINFGLNYGMSAQGLCDSIWDATGEKIDLETAKDCMSRYFEEFEGVANFHQEAHHFATIHGYCQTLFGRRRYLPDIDSALAYKRRRAKRLATNGPVQGSAADVIKIAMVNLHRLLSQHGFSTKMILQVHDELLFDVPKSEIDKVVPLIRDAMQNAVALTVPMLVEIGQGKNWLEAH